MIAGPRRPAPFVASIAMKASATVRFSSRNKGARRLSAAIMDNFGVGWSPLLSVYVVVTGAALRVINLHVLRRCRHQFFVRSGSENLTFHQENNLVVLFHRCNLLSYRQQSDAGIVSMHIFQNLP